MSKFLGGLATVIVVLAIGIGHFLADGGNSFFDKLGGWVETTEKDSKEVDQGKEAATDFRVPALPVTISDVTKNDATGKIDGVVLEASENSLAKAAGLSDEEARHAGCFLATKVINGELSLRPPEAEEEILEYASERFVEISPALEEREEASDFREELADAKNDGEAAFKGALAFICSSVGEDVLEP